MKKLIVNADDFGLHPLINAGIIKGYREGFITSTSLMPSAPCWQEAVQLAQENPQLGIGVHLTLVGSVAPVLPAGKVSSLLDEQGLFWRITLPLPSAFTAAASSAASWKRSYARKSKGRWKLK